MIIESFLKSGPGRANMLYITNPARNKIDDISCCAYDVTFCLKGGSGDITSKGMWLLNMLMTCDAPIVAPESPMGTSARTKRSLETERCQKVSTGSSGMACWRQSEM